MGILLIPMGTTSKQFPQRSEEGAVFPETGVYTIVSCHTGAGKQTSIREVSAFNGRVLFSFQ